MIKSHPERVAFFVSMLRRLKFILVQLATWLCFFELARAIFLFYHHGQSSQLSFTTILLTFVHGFRMDLSMACYLIILSGLFVLLSVFIPFFRRPLLYKIYSGIVLFSLLVIVLADLEIYNEWGYRLDSTVLQYLSSPKEVWASTGHLPVFWILFVFVLAFAGLLFCFNLVLNRAAFLLRPAKERKFLSVVVIAAFLALLIVPMRGGFQMQPMNPSWVYFSTNNFANISALNAPWYFFQDVMDKQRGISNPYLYLSAQQSNAIVDSLYQRSDAHVQLVDTSKGKANILLIVWESFTAKVVDTTIQGKEVVPNFNRLKGEGIYFNNMYASGDRTHKGMSAIFSGYPALPNTSIIRFPQKSAKLTLISNLANQHGYHNNFYYGGDPDYDNYKSYWLHGQFNITGGDAFSSKDKLSEWGALDGAVANYMINDFANWKPPFFNSWLTLTSHVPYKIPVAPVFSGSDETTLFLNSIHYTDQVIGNFIQHCKQQPWWDNTIIIITADHGIRFPETGKVIRDFKVPMLWLGGAVAKNRGMVINRLGSQMDIPASLARQFGWNASAFPFSRDLTDSTSVPFAFFSNSVSFGLVQPKKYFVYDFKGAEIREQQGKIEKRDIDAARAMQQFIYSDYLKK